MCFELDFKSSIWSFQSGCSAVIGSLLWNKCTIRYGWRTKARCSGLDRELGATKNRFSAVKFLTSRRKLMFPQKKNFLVLKWKDLPVGIPQSRGIYILYHTSNRNQSVLFGEARYRETWGRLSRNLHVTTTMPPWKWSRMCEYFIIVSRIHWRTAYKWWIWKFFKKILTGCEVYLYHSLVCDGSTLESLARAVALAPRAWRYV